MAGVLKDLFKIERIFQPKLCFPPSFSPFDSPDYTVRRLTIHLCIHHYKAFSNSFSRSVWVTWDLNDLIKWSHWKIESPFLRGVPAFVWRSVAGKPSQPVCFGSQYFRTRFSEELRWGEAVVFYNISCIKYLSNFIFSHRFSSPVRLQNLHSESVKHWNFYDSNVYNQTFLRSPRSLAAKCCLPTLFSLPSISQGARLRLVRRT